GFEPRSCYEEDAPMWGVFFVRGRLVERVTSGWGPTPPARTTAGITARTTAGITACTTAGITGARGAGPRHPGSFADCARCCATMPAVVPARGPVSSVMPVSEIAEPVRQKDSGLDAAHELQNPARASICSPQS